MAVTLTNFRPDTGMPAIESARRAMPTTTTSATIPAANRRYSPMVLPKIRIASPFLKYAFAGGRVSLRRRDACERLQKPAPVPFGIEDAPHLVATRPETIQATMLELDSRAVLAFGDETHLDLGLEVRVGLPVGADVPGQH